MIDWELTEKKTYELLNKVGLSIDPNLLVAQIGVGQLVEIKLKHYQNPSVC